MLPDTNLNCTSLSLNISSHGNVLITGNVLQNQNSRLTYPDLTYPDRLKACFPHLPFTALFSCMPPTHTFWRPFFFSFKVCEANLKAPIGHFWVCVVKNDENLLTYIPKTGKVKGHKNYKVALLLQKLLTFYDSKASLAMIHNCWPTSKLIRQLIHFTWQIKSCTHWTLAYKFIILIFLPAFHMYVMKFTEN